MATSTRPPPTEPLVVILGSTGTGKSELAVELASRFNGEVINTDAIQLYKGLPIITNKITLPERRGVPHHLLDHIDLDSPTWVVDDFKCAARSVIAEIRSRGRLPVVVGGTHYYTNSLLFKDILVGDGSKEEPASTFPLLDEPTEVLHAKLREVDPAMAEKWHPNDRRKISRSLEIWLKYGRPASEIYAEQKRKKAERQGTVTQDEHGDDGSADPWENLLFWVHTDSEVLKQRLNSRVDKMLEAGLVQETQQMFEHHKTQEARGESVDFTRGIWQAIGYKEFYPYLSAVDRDRHRDLSGTGEAALSPKEADKLHAAAVEGVKVSTRQYAKYQTRWTKTKTVPLLRERRGAMDGLFVLDSTDATRWADDVAGLATDVTRKFLAGDPMPEPARLSAKASQVLEEATVPQAQRTVCQKTCEICGVTLVTEEQWEKHVKSKKHKARLRGPKKRGPVPDEAERQGNPSSTANDVDAHDGTHDTTSRASTPDLDLGSLHTSPPG